MGKKKYTDNIKPPTDPANLSQNTGDMQNIPAGAKNGAGQGAGKGTKG